MANHTDQTAEMKNLDCFQLETQLCLLGESSGDYGDGVCGSVVNVKAKGGKSNTNSLT